jgi:hypothetical protein
VHNHIMGSVRKRKDSAGRSASPPKYEQSGDLPSISSSSSSSSSSLTLMLMPRFPRDEVVLDRVRLPLPTIAYGQRHDHKERSTALWLTDLHENHNGPRVRHSPS